MLSKIIICYCYDDDLTSLPVVCSLFVVCANEKEGERTQFSHKTPTKWKVIFFVIFGGGLWNGEEHLSS
jgi:hypothetical protein